jgi:hypothetical protein
MLMFSNWTLDSDMVLSSTLPLGVGVVSFKLIIFTLDEDDKLGSFVCTGELTISGAWLKSSS